ncbi:TIGR01906 family membrane protein [Clostridium magnum]|uniref:Integral membrane protein n=1 Tax=Clostridium magnum DSM 2767 TaxID=1121326 RepID=A0A162U369_9CLOT|nr:TIGR01906 family membrane protein [Clostridium magnum]KZL93380.1 hypothetical protein CLMAG_04040 [Clostridium magnum DSM 2767]SHI16081.1 integral membrane protein TIGR01906 [Clostridium magnum DSM 2767]
MRTTHTYIYYFSKLLLTIFLFLFVFIFSVKVTLNFKPLYYFDIKYLNIEKYTNLNIEQIKSTYDYLINYINTPKPTGFKIPLLISSREGIIHFEEVKKLFTNLDYILLISTLFIALGAYFMKKNRDFSPLKWCSNLLFFCCLLILTAFFINFNKSFDRFHEIFFNNDYWLLSPQTDPVINILPEEYFLHCSILILILVLCWSVILRVIYKKINSSKGYS